VVKRKNEYFAQVPVPGFLFSLVNAGLSAIMAGDLHCADL
jgi:hypothetical protein